MSNDVAGGLRNVLPGNIDSQWGPYATLAAANTAIPNTVIGGKSYREGKIVAIGSAPPYRMYWWAGNDYADNKLVEYVDFSDYSKSDELLYGLNEYNYNEDISGFYVDGTTGTLTVNASSKVSRIIPAAPGDTRYLLNRNSNAGFRYIDASGNPLKPLRVDGTPFTLYTDQMNGAFKAPSGTVGLQFTTVFVGTGTPSLYQLSTSDTGRNAIKDNLLPILDPAPKNRINKGQNTNNPDAFGAAVASGSNFGTTVVPDTTSPTASILGYKSVFSNTTVADLGTLFRTYDIPIGTLRPSTISIAFWVKKSEFTSIYTTKIQIYLGNIRSYEINPTLVVNGTPQTSTGNAAVLPEFTSATMTMTKIAEVGAYIRLRITFSSILWKGSYTGTSIRYWYLFNQAYFFNKTMEFIDFTVLFDAEPQGTVVYPDPLGAFRSNVPTIAGLGQELDVSNAKVATIQNELLRDKKMLVTYALGNIYISTPWDSTKNFVTQFNVSKTSSFTDTPNIDIVKDYLALKDGDQTIQSSLIKTSADDTTPISVNGSYLGGGHGWVHARILNLTAHGMTFADIGSVRQNGAGVQFVILYIVNANSLWIASKNQSVDGYSYSFPAPTGPLTYVSNGLSAATLDGYGSTVGLQNLFPSISESTRTFLLDGKTLMTAEGKYYAEFLDINESYVGYSLPSIIDKLIANRPVGGYTSNVLFNSLGADVLIKFNIVYKCMSNGAIIIASNNSNMPDVSSSFQGMMQADALAVGDVYVPKSLPIDGGNRVYDFRNIEAWTTGPTNPIHMTPAYWENPLSPPDRVLNMNSEVVLQLAYAPERGLSVNRKDKVYDAMYLNTTKKLYPMAVSQLGNVKLLANSFYSCVAVRQYTRTANNPAGRTNYCWYELNGVVWIYLDYHGSLMDKIVSEQKWIGRAITIHEKTANVKIMAEVVTDSIEILSAATSTVYGFAVLKLA